MPQLFAGARVDGPRPVVRARRKQDAIQQQRCGLEAPASRHVLRLERPLDGEIGYIRRCDLREGAVPPAGVISRIRQPTRRVLEAVANVREGDFGKRG